MFDEVYFTLIWITYDKKKLFHNPWSWFEYNDHFACCDWRADIVIVELNLIHYSLLMTISPPPPPQEIKSFVDFIIDY